MGSGVQSARVTAEGEGKGWRPGWNSAAGDGGGVAGLPDLFINKHV